MIESTTAACGVAEMLETTEEMDAYLEACIQISEGDSACIAKALGDITRANGTAQIARERGMSHQRLYKGQSGDQGSTYHTISKGFLALELCMRASVKQGAAKKMWLRLLNCSLFSSSPQSLPVGGDTSNKPFEWTGHQQLSALPPPPPASCLPLKVSVKSHHDDFSRQPPSVHHRKRI